MAGDDGAKCLVCIVGVIVGIGVILTVILVPMSFSGVEYYEYGFKKQKSTGSVKTDKVYYGGKYMVGPDYTFKTFPATAHYVSLSPVSVFTWNKLEIEIDIFFQYFLRPEDLPLLHKFYDKVYEPTIIKSAVAALKVEAPKHDTWKFIRNRRTVEEQLFKAVRLRLGGSCCAEDCLAWEYACPTDCTQTILCNAETDKGLWVDVKFFQMGEVVIPEEVEERYLRTLTVQEDVLKVGYSQNSSIVRKETEAIVRDIHNKAAELRQNAKADAELIRTVSRANFTATVEKARAKGLKSLYSQLGITDQETKSSFDYLRTLRGLDNIHLTVDFQQRIVGGFGSG